MTVFVLSFFSPAVVTAPGDSQRVEIPRRDMEVVKGQMAVLQAWYSPNSDIHKNTVIWNFMANESKQVSELRGSDFKTLTALNFLICLEKY